MATMDVNGMMGALRALDQTLQKSLKAASVESSDPTIGADVSEKDITKREVYIRVVFIKIGDIQTVQENFQADVMVQTKWREPKLDGKGKNEERDFSAEWEKYWNPRVYVENAINDPKESVWYLVQYDDQEHGHICQRRRIKGMFFERMELNSYPFDSQDLGITVTTHRGENELDLIADPSEISSVNTQSFVDEQEWKLHRHMSSKVKVTTNAYKSSRHKHPAVTISCKASRRFNFFLWNIILIMVFIAILLFSTFAVDVLLVQNRLQLSFILLLTNITFKFNIAQTLPKVSYLTLLDIYIILQMSMMCLVCLWHAVVYLVYTENNEDKPLALYVDRIGFWVALALYLLFQIVFVIYVVFLVKRKLTLFEEKEEKQKEMMSMMDVETGKKGKKRQILPLNTSGSQPGGNTDKTSEA